MRRTHTTHALSSLHGTKQNHAEEDADSIKHDRQCVRMHPKASERVKEGVSHTHLECIRVWNNMHLQLHSSPQSVCLLLRNYSLKHTHTNTVADTYTHGLKQITHMEPH